MPFTLRITPAGPQGSQTHQATSADHAEVNGIAARPPFSALMVPRAPAGETGSRRFLIRATPGGDWGWRLRPGSGGTTPFGGMVAGCMMYLLCFNSNDADCAVICGHEMAERDQVKDDFTVFSSLSEYVPPTEME
jgi:hypothetical protein